MRIPPLSPIPVYRLKLTFSILCFALLGLMGRVAQLQLVQGFELESRARDYQTKKVEPLGKRRTIVDRRGRLIALDEKRYRLYVHPSKFQFAGDVRSVLRKPEEVAEKLQGLLPLSNRKLISQLGKWKMVKLFEEELARSERDFKQFLKSRIITSVIYINYFIFMLFFFNKSI